MLTVGGRRQGQQAPRTVGAVITFPKALATEEVYHGVYIFHSEVQTGLTRSTTRALGIKLLLDITAAVDGGTPLIMASQNAYVGAIELLLGGNSAVGAANVNRGTPLMVVAKYGNRATVQSPLANNASFGACNDEVATPLLSDNALA